MGSPSDSRNGRAPPQRIIEQVRRAASIFRERFGRAPTIAAAAPGRVNLIGEHTDYNQGFVLPIAIERETVIALDRTPAAASRLHAADLDAQLEVDLSRPLKPQRGVAGNHLLGVADQFQRRGHSVPNVDAVIVSSVPIGAGLSSSAAVEVAFATALETLLSAPLTPLEKARLCQAAEHAFAGTPCGIMDMYIVAAARPDHALLIDCRSDEARAVPCDLAARAAALLVIDTGVAHDLGAGAYADRRRACEAVADALGQPSLRSVTLEMLNVVGLNNEQRRRALHVISENMRTVLAAEALALGNLPRLGELMLHSHASLRDLYQVSCAELDAIVELAAAMRDAGDGVFGARMTGGGFGGCAIVLCRRTAVERVRARIARAFTERFDRAPAGMFTTAAAGGAIPAPLGG